MNTTTTTTTATAEKTTFEQATEIIISCLENGTYPWSKIRKTGGAINRISRNPYGILNQMLLKHSGEYATFNQWKSLDGKVKKGEKGETVFFWRPVKGDGDKVRYEFKSYKVFHISQVEGVAPLDPAEDVQNLDIDQVLHNYLDREKISIGAADVASYNPIEDKIYLPSGDTGSCNYSVLLHEIIHSTGHPKRLHRTNAGSVQYNVGTFSKEELIAKMGTAFILNGLQCTGENEVEFDKECANKWITLLREHSLLIVRAASAAERAAKYVLDNN